MFPSRSCILWCLLIASCALGQPNEPEEIVGSNDVKNGTDTTTSPVTIIPDPSTTVAPRKDEPFAVKDKSGNVCLLVAFKATFTLPYNKTTSDKTELISVDFNSTNSHYTGSCGNGSTPEVLSIFWRPNNMAVTEEISSLNSNEWAIEMAFTTGKSDTPEAIDKDKLKFKLTKFVLVYQLENETFPFTNFTGTQTLTLKFPQFLANASVGVTYRCNTERSASFEELPEAELKLRDLKVDAFRSSKEIEFSKNEWLCNEDIILSAVVPIVIGVILLLLVVLALVAYFLGRHKANTKRSTYQQM